MSEWDMEEHENKKWKTIAMCNLFRIVPSKWDSILIMCMDWFGLVCVIRLHRAGHDCICGFGKVYIEQNILEHGRWCGPVVGNVWLASHTQLLPWLHEEFSKWLSESLAVSIHSSIHHSQGQGVSSQQSRCEGDLKAQRQNQIKRDRTAQQKQHSSLHSAFISALICAGKWTHKSQNASNQDWRWAGRVAENRHHFSLLNPGCLLGGRTNFTTFRINACSFGAVPLRRPYSSGEGWNLQIPFKGSCWKSHPTSRRPGEAVGGWRLELTWRRGSAVTRYSTCRRTDGTTFSFSSSRGNEDVSQQEVRWAAAPPASKQESSG